MIKIRQYRLKEKIEKKLFYDINSIMKFNITTIINPHIVVILLKRNRI